MQSPMGISLRSRDIFPLDLSKFSRDNGLVNNRSPENANQYILALIIAPHNLQTAAVGVGE